MTVAKSTTETLGYVSAYLNQPQRSLAEAEKDREAAQRRDQEAESQDNVNAGRETATGS
jgi:hypothetical protein